MTDSQLVKRGWALNRFDVEVDNSDVPRVIKEGYKPKQFQRIPSTILKAAVEFDRSVQPTYTVRPRNSTPGLRRAVSSRARPAVAEASGWTGKKIVSGKPAGSCRPWGS